MTTIPLWLAAISFGAGLMLLLKHIALDASAIPETSDFPIQLDDWRKQASIDRSEELPLSLNALSVAEVTTWRAGVVAGGGLKRHKLAMAAFQVEYRDATILIDSVYDRPAHEAMNRGQPYFDERFDRLQQAMLRAKTILVTHEHVDHIGGIAKSPFYDQIAGK